MAQGSDPRQYFCRRRLRSIGPFSRRDLLALLLAGQIDGSTLIRQTDESVLRPLALSDAAELIPTVGKIWCKWATPWRLWGLLLVWPLLAGVALRLYQYWDIHEVWGPHLALLVVAVGLVLWLYRLWRITLSDAMPYRALGYTLPLLFPPLGWLWVWVGYFSLGRYLRVLSRRKKLPPLSPAPLFLTSVFLYYLALFGIAGRWMIPGFQTLPVIYEVVFVTLAWYVVTVFSLLLADWMAMRILRKRVENMIDSLLGVVCRVDYSALFQAEAFLRTRLRRSTQVIALLILFLSLAPQVRLDYCEIAAIYTRKFLASMPSVRAVPPEIYREVAARAPAAAAELERSLLVHDVDLGADALLELAETLRFSLEEYQSAVPWFALRYGHILLKDGGRLIGEPGMSAAGLERLQRRLRYGEYRVRLAAVAAVHRYVQNMLTVLPMERPFAVNAAMETAMVLPGYAWSDLYEILPELELPAEGQGRTGSALRRPHSRVEALRFLVRVNSVLLNLRMLQSAVAVRLYERRYGRLPENLRMLAPSPLMDTSCNPFTGNLLEYHPGAAADAPPETGFRLSAGSWPGVPEVPCREYLAPEITVRIPPRNP